MYQVNTRAVLNELIKIEGHLSPLGLGLSSIITDVSLNGVQTDKLEVNDSSLNAAVLQHNTANDVSNNGIMALAVRNDANTSLVSADGDYSALQVDASGNLKVIDAGGGGGADLSEVTQRDNFKSLRTEDRIYLINSEMDDTAFDSSNYATAEYTSDPSRGFIFTANETPKHQLISNYIPVFPTGDYDMVYECSLAQTNGSNADIVFGFETHESANDVSHNQFFIGLASNNKNIQFHNPGEGISITTTAWNIDSANNNYYLDSFGTGKRQFRIITSRHRQIFYQMYNHQLHRYQSFHIEDVGGNYRLLGSEIRTYLSNDNVIDSDGTVTLDHQSLYLKDMSGEIDRQEKNILILPSLSKPVQEFFVVTGTSSISLIGNYAGKIAYWQTNTYALIFEVYMTIVDNGPINMDEYKSGSAITNGTDVYYRRNTLDARKSLLNGEPFTNLMEINRVADQFSHITNNGNDYVFFRLRFEKGIPLVPGGQIGVNLHGDYSTLVTHSGFCKGIQMY